MVVLEAIGLAATDIFDYNRENFKWDQELRFKKNETRIGMQIERFDLFREDIEDLVNLTVGKMDMYHGVGEIFLAFSLTLYTEGRLLDSSPPFYTSMYFFSVACAWIYILVAVWLAVYASITAHSFGVRLRTRYVRLPIPSLAHINRLTAKLTDFEKQGVQDMMRVPFSTSDAPAWQYRGGGDPQASSSSSAQRRGSPGTAAEGDLLGPGIAAFGKDCVLDAAETHVEKHVQLYRRLQAKWQCFDAYSRVSMALGVNYLLQAVNFFVIGITLVNSRSPSCGYALTAVFQACRLALGYLDIAGMHKTKITMVQLLGTVPVLIVLVSISIRKGYVRDETRGIASAVAFFIMAIWHQLLIGVAKPSDDEACLPRNYRTVLFLDVYGGESYDPTEAEHRHVTADDAHTAGREFRERQAATAEMALSTAQAALRRWEAVPRKLLPEAQRSQVTRLRQDYSIWRKSYQGHLVQMKSARDLPANDSLRDQHELRPWSALSAHEREEDEFANAWLGPLPRAGGAGERYYSPELGREAPEVPPSSQRVLTLEELAAHVATAADVVKEVLHGSEPAGAVARTPEKSSGAAGKSAKAHRVVRLPWKVVHFLSRVMQLMWLLLGGMQAAEVWAGHSVLHPERFPWEKHLAPAPAPAERRLLELAPATVGNAFSTVEVAWPHGAFFRPEAVAHVARAGGGAGTLLVGSPYAHYAAATPGGAQLKMEALRGLDWPGAVPLCAQLPDEEARGLERADQMPCLWAALTDRGVSVRRFSRGNGEDAGEAVLPLPGKPWRSLAGAVMSCGDLASLLTPKGLPEWCLLLTGWDGSRVPLAVAPLAAGPLRPPEPTERPEVRFDFAVADARAAGGAVPDAVLSLHVEAQASRVWALLAGGQMQAWDLKDLRSLGRWHAQWPSEIVRGGFSAAALCTGDGALWVAGPSEEDGPALLRAELPSELRGARESPGA